MGTSQRNCIWLERTAQLVGRAAPSNIYIPMCSFFEEKSSWDPRVVPNFGWFFVGALSGVQFWWDQKFGHNSEISSFAPKNQHTCTSVLLSAARSTHWAVRSSQMKYAGSTKRQHVWS
eukprot:g65059.t1